MALRNNRERLENFKYLGELITVQKRNMAKIIFSKKRFIYLLVSLIVLIGINYAIAYTNNEGVGHDLNELSPVDCGSGRFLQGIGGPSNYICANVQTGGSSGSFSCNSLYSCSSAQLDPGIGSLVNGKYCVASGGVINCNQNAPSGSGANCGTQGTCTDVFASGSSGDVYANDKVQASRFVDRHNDDYYLNLDSNSYLKNLDVSGNLLVDGYIGAEGAITAGGGFATNNDVNVGGKVDLGRGYIKSYPSTNKVKIFTGQSVTGILEVDGRIAASGTKNFDIEHPNKEKAEVGIRLQHAAIESPEVRLYYEGKGKIENGKAIIELPSYFNEIIVEGTEIVHLTEYSRGNVWVDKEDYENLRLVVEGDENTEFSWLISGIREGYSDFEAEYLA